MGTKRLDIDIHDIPTDVSPVKPDSVAVGPFISGSNILELLEVGYVSTGYGDVIDDENRPPLLLCAKVGTRINTYGRDERGNELVFGVRYELASGKFVHLAPKTVFEDGKLSITYHLMHYLVDLPERGRATNVVIGLFSRVLIPGLPGHPPHSMLLPHKISNMIELNQEILYG